MFNPLVDDLSNLKDQDVDDKIRELSKKYLTASRLPDQSLARQVREMLTIYKQELLKRQNKQFSDAQKKRDQDLDTLINVE
jgi:hypothetical protein